MTLLTECASLQKMPIFAHLETEKCKLLAMSSDRLHYQKEDIVFEEGDRSDAVYFMLSGCVRISRNLNGSQVHFAEVVGPAVLGETGVICGVPRSTRVVAIEETTILRNDASVFLELLDYEPTLARGLVRKAGLSQPALVI